MYIFFSVVDLFFVKTPEELNVFTSTTNVTPFSSGSVLVHNNVISTVKPSGPSPCVSFPHMGLSLVEYIPHVHYKRMKTLYHTYVRIQL